MFPNDLRAEYDHQVLDVNQRVAKAAHLKRALVAAALWQAPAHILDVGCGSGLILAALDAPTARKVGCDFRSTLFHSAPSPVQFVQGDANALPFRANKFDLVICLAVIEEIKDGSSLLENLANCVAPGGVLYVTITNGRFLTPLYALGTNVGLRVRPSARWYARASLRFSRAPKQGFGVAGLRDWQFVNVTPYLMRAHFPFLRVVPFSILAWVSNHFAPSFAYAWRRLDQKSES